MMNTISPRWLLLALAFMIGPSNGAAPLAPEDVPPALRPWTAWVLHGHEDQACPFLYNDASVRRCTWPARLQLSVSPEGGEFSQDWEVMRDGWVALPGDGDHWPQHVLADGEPLAVAERGGSPAAFLEAGRHTVRGSFSWTRLPDALPVPPETGLVTLTVGQRTVDHPSLDTAGRLWLQGGRGAASPEAQQENRLEFSVHRLLDDTIPPMLTTEVVLRVAGRAREVLLGQTLPAGFLAMALDSPLPARLEPDGRLRVQVRPGTWTVTLKARHQGTLAGVTLQRSEGPWAAEEVWVFRAHPNLRLVSIEGATPVDPRQTTLPERWQRLPAYRMVPGLTLRLVEKRRGDPTPAPNQLSLQRTLWLDFDGLGYTFRDRITGTMTSGWRLEMNEPAQLGRLTVDGQDRFITRLPGSSAAGVEVRHGAIDLAAEGRIDGRRARLPAAGWAQEFQQVTTTLHLPPGWTLLDAAGADRAPRTWLNRWTLLDLFVVLMVAIATARLWGWPWGLLALITLVLTYQEPGAPRWVWLSLLAAIALLRVVPQGWGRRLVRGYRDVSWVVLALIAVPFLVQQARQGLYPQLEHANAVSTVPSIQLPMPAAQQQPAAPPSETAMLGRAAPADLGGRRYGYPSGGAAPDTAPRTLAQIDPNAAVQTGPGLPHWQWTTATLAWNGPLEPGQELRLALIPPPVNAGLALLRIILIALLMLGLSGIRYRPGSGWGGRSVPRALSGAGLLLLAPLLANAPSVKAELPTQVLLDELRARLLEPPECAPSCASAQRAELEVTAQALTVRMEINSFADAALPLPGQAQHWLPRSVLLDGQPAATLGRDSAGILWVVVPEGRHEILLEGPLPARDTVQLPLPLKPHILAARATGWVVEGVHEDGAADQQLVLRRAANEEPGAPGTTLESATLPPFVRVERTLFLGLTWEVATRVVRVSPPDGAVVLSVPLLEGESPLSPGVRAQDGKVAVSMAPGEQEAKWRSVLTPRAIVALKAPDTLAWTEVWRAEISPLWHLQWQGIPQVGREEAGTQWLPQWRPWPGEAVTLRITRPEGVAGRTLTVDRSALEVTPGRRVTQTRLTVSLRSSRGGQYSLRLPAHATLQEVTVDGKSQPVSQEDGALTVPVVPGSQTIELLFREHRGITWRFETPAPVLGVESVNARIWLKMPRDRWVLLTGGPRVGPAVLFWGVLAVLALLAFLLGRVRLTPLATRHWLLLGLGLTQVPIEIALVVVGWLLALGWRDRLSAQSPRWLFNGAQIGLSILTVLALGALFLAIEQGLLGEPEMQVAGNGSNGYQLHWYQDRMGAMAVQGWAISLPMVVYRLAMLAWALWLAFALLRWLRWGWNAFTRHGAWRSVSLEYPWTKRASTARDP